MSEREIFIKLSNAFVFHDDDDDNGESIWRSTYYVKIDNIVRNLRDFSNYLVRKFEFNS